MLIAVAVVHWGIGRHGQAVGATNVREFLKGLYAYEIFYCATITFVKVSILLFYARIFHVMNNMKAAWWLTMGVVIAWFLATVRVPLELASAMWLTSKQEVVAVLKCLPIHSLWDRDVAGHCIDLKKYQFGAAIPNIATDLLLLVAPIPFVMKLQIAQNQKAAVVFMFALGGV